MVALAVRKIVQYTQHQTESFSGEPNIFIKEHVFVQI